MNKINICGLNKIDDPFYRYKMTKLVISRSKRGKTAIENINNLADDLERNPNLIIEFLKRKFSTNFIHKSDILTTSRNINYEELESAIREFIEYFVLCPVCYLPETFIENDNSKFVLNCKCCASINYFKLTGKNKSIDKTIENIGKFYPK